MDGDFDIETERPHLPAVAAESRPQNLIFASAECGEVFGALCEMQGTMISPKRTKTAKVNGRTRQGAEYDYSYAYAPLEEIISTIKEPMAKAHLAYRQFLAVRNNAHVMRTIIVHPSGQWLGCDYPIFWEESRGMQGFASGVTYARRYGLMLALGIAAEDDDDANVADGRPAVINNGQQGRSRSATAPKASPDDSNSPNSVKPHQEPSGASNERKERTKDAFKALAASLNTAPDGETLLKIRESRDWLALDKEIREIEGEDVGREIMAKLDARLDERRSYLLGQMEPEGYQ